MVEGGEHLTQAQPEQIGRDALRIFQDQYHIAKVTLGWVEDSHTVLPAMRGLLQDLYQQLPFEEMKRKLSVGGVSGYWSEHTVRPPEEN